ncbi:hypothetical protein [Gemmatimonas sp.]|uniref:hypothetical protein n=1 Tax=Gemmatimonas sp. TaxID=1962908 RepID=UPI0039832530
MHRFTSAGWHVVLASLCISAPALRAQSPFTLTTAKPSAPCDANVPLRVTLPEATATQAAVQLTSSVPSVIPPPPILTIPAGQTTGFASLPCIPTSQSVAVTISATIGASTQSVLLNVLAPVLQSVSVKPNESHIAGVPTKSFEAAVRLAGPAPTGGVVATLSLSPPEIATIPSTLSVPAGASGTTFTVTTVRPVNQPTVVTVTATALGTSRTTTFSVLPAGLASLGIQDVRSLAAARFVAIDTTIGGKQRPARVVLADIAGAGGQEVRLSSSSPAVSLPASVRVPEGDTVAEFEIRTNPVSQTAVVTLTAALGTVSRTATIVVPAWRLSAMNMPTLTVGGNTAEAEVFGDSPTPAGGMIVPLSSSSPAVLVPSTITIPAGAKSVRFAVVTKNVDVNTSATVTATVGNSTVSRTMTIAAEGITDFTIASPGLIRGNPTVQGGTTTTGRLVAPTGHNGFVVQLASSSADATVPARVSFAPNETSKSFSIATRGVVQNSEVEITARVTSSNPITGSLTSRTISDLSSLTVAPASSLKVQVGSVALTRTVTLVVLR